MEKLTSTQEKALDYIRTMLRSSGRSPTLREICTFMGYSAVGSAQDLVTALRRKGYLETPNRQSARSIIPTHREPIDYQLSGSEDFEAYMVPCLGSVPAGNPLEAVEERIGMIRISSGMISSPKPRADQLFAVQAKGLSMMNAGILDGDWLVVKSQKEADTGNIVLARVESSHDVTVKRLMKDKDGWFLQPENTDFFPLYAKDDPFHVIGRVIALQRMFSM